MAVAKAAMEKFFEEEAKQDSTDTMKTKETQKRQLSRKPRRIVPVEPLTIKLDETTRQRIYHEVARRKAKRLPSRTIQGVVQDAVAKFLAEAE